MSSNPGRPLRHACTAGHDGAIAGYGSVAFHPDESRLTPSRAPPTARSAPVAELTGAKVAPPGTAGRFKAVARWAMLNLRGRSVRSHALEAEVQIGRKGIDKALSHAEDTLLSAFPAIPAFLTHGTRMGQPVDPRDTKDDSTKAWRLLGVVVRMDGLDVTLVVHVREAQNGWFFYDLGKNRHGGTGEPQRNGP